MHNHVFRQPNTGKNAKLCRYFFVLEPNNINLIIYKIKIFIFMVTSMAYKVFTFESKKSTKR